MRDDEVLESLLVGRWSCRAYEDRPVERAVVERLLRLAQRTPSWCNTQPWQVVVTEGEGTRAFVDGLAAHLADPDPSGPDLTWPSAYEGTYRERRRTSGFQLYDAVGIERGDRAASGAQTARNFELFGAPHVAIVTSEAALGTAGMVDCGLYVQTFLLAARALGLGAVPQAALAGFPVFVRDHFGLPENRLVVCGISFGHADEADPVNGYRTERADLDDVVTWVS